MNKLFFSVLVADYNSPETFRRKEHFSVDWRKLNSRSCCCWRDCKLTLTLTRSVITVQYSHWWPNWTHSTEQHCRILHAICWRQTHRLIRAVLYKLALTAVRRRWSHWSEWWTTDQWARRDRQTLQPHLLRHLPILRRFVPQPRHRSSSSSFHCLWQLEGWTTQSDN